jgi:hypothetical protein
MHNDRDLYDEPGDDDTQTAERESWRQAVVPAEPDEDGEIEEVEGEEIGAEGESDEGHVEGREFVEADDEEASPLSEEQIAELRELQIAANEESRALGLPNFDIDAYMQALREADDELIARTGRALQASSHPDRSTNEADRLLREARSKQINSALDLLLKRKAA